MGKYKKIIYILLIPIVLILLVFVITTLLYQNSRNNNKIEEIDSSIDITEKVFNDFISNNNDKIKLEYTKEINSSAYEINKQPDITTENQSSKIIIDNEKIDAKYNKYGLDNNKIFEIIPYNELEYRYVITTNDNDGIFSVFKRENNKEVLRYYFEKGTITKMISFGVGEQKNIASEEINEKTIQDITQKYNYYINL